MYTWLCTFIKWPGRNFSQSEATWHPHRESSVVCLLTISFLPCKEGNMYRKGAPKKQVRCSRPLVCTLCIHTRSCSISLPNIKHIKGYGCFHLWGLSTRNNCRIQQPPAVSQQLSICLTHLDVFNQPVINLEHLLRKISDTNQYTRVKVDGTITMYWFI